MVYTFNGFLTDSPQHLTNTSYVYDDNNNFLSAGARQQESAETTVSALSQSDTQVCTMESALVGFPPDVHLLGGLDQLLPELRMCNADQCFCPLPGAESLQVHHAVFGDDIVDTGAGVGDDGAVGQGGNDPALQSAVLGGHSGRHTDKALAAF